MSSRIPSRGERYHHGNLRAELLAQARELLECEGSAALSLREIARRAGVAAPSAYHHFASLDAIAVALAEQGFADLAASLEGAPGDDAERLAGIGLSYVRFAVSHPGLYRLMFGDGLKAASTRSPALHALRQRAIAPVELALRDRLPGEEIGKAAMFLWSVVHGLALLTIDGQMADDADADETVAAVLRFAGHGLGLSSKQ